MASSKALRWIDVTWSLQIVILVVSGFFVINRLEKVKRSLEDSLLDQGVAVKQVQNVSNAFTDMNVSFSLFMAVIFSAINVSFAALSFGLRRWDQGQTNAHQNREGRAHLITHSPPE